MTTRAWKRLQPNSLRDALRLCKDYALAEKRLSVERIADLMDVTADLLYKWLSNGRMPVSLIPAYEHICGIDYVTRWLAAHAGRLLIDIPSGRAATAVEMQVLQEALNTATGQLLQFYAGRAQAPEALAAIQTAMQGLAWHRVNVQKTDQPELDLQEGA